jgi:tripartite ATP-independent transporter DctM subunit
MGAARVTAPACSPPVSGTGTPAATTPSFLRLADGVTGAATGAAVLALLAMVAAISYEVFARTLFNAPTSWVTEVAAYLLVAVAFLGLAVAEKEGAHIQVDLLLNVLPEGLRRETTAVAQWVGLFCVLICAWQLAQFNASEFVNGSRSWGLLSTPLWLPEVPMTLGFAVFALATLASCLRDSLLGGRTRRLLPWAALVVLVLGLSGLGRLPVMVPGTRFDVGTMMILATVLALALAFSGRRIALALAAVLGVGGLLFWAARGAPLGWIGALLGLSILFFLLSGVRIALALGMVAIFGLFFLLGRPQLSTLAERAWTSINTFTLTAVPMFVMMSALLLRSGVTSRMFDALVKWFGRTPGGLAHASVGAATIFAAVSGSSIATAATLGQVACPDMIARGYSPRLTYGVTAAGATLGIMIPPSIAMIIYGSTVGAPIDLLFLAGIVPGLLLALIFMLAAWLWTVLVPGSAPRGHAYPMREKLASLVNILPFMAVVGAVLGSLYAGVATPTEAGALGVLMSVVLCLAFGAFSWRALIDVASDTVKVTAFIMLIVVCASALSWVFDYLRLPRAMVDLVLQAQLSPWLVIAAISVVFLVLGMFVESISMMLMTLPVTYPVVIALGFDPIWFGIFLVLMVETGLITPPVGIVLFVLRGVSGDVSLKEIAMGALPFVGLLLSFVALMVAFPGLVTWLPNLMK